MKESWSDLARALMARTMADGDVADAARVLQWARDRPRRAACIAFTAGAERQAAYWIEWAEAEERRRCHALAEAALQRAMSGDWEGADRLLKAIRDGETAVSTAEAGR